MADNPPPHPQTEYSVAGNLLYMCLYFQLQEVTYIQSQIQFIQTAMQFGLFVMCSHYLDIVSSDIIIIWVLNSPFGFIFQDLNFVKFYDLVKLKTCEVMYRAFNKTLPVNLNNIYTVCESNCLYNMRKKKDFVQKYTRTNIKQCLSQ